MVVKWINLSKLYKNIISFFILRKWVRFVIFFIFLSFLNGYPLKLSYIINNNNIVIFYKKIF